MKGNISITGGASFIDSHVVRLLVTKCPDYHIFNLGKLTYAGNLDDVADIANAPNYTFIEADICDYERMRGLFKKYHIDGVIRLAAESHVDRSTENPLIFAKANVMGTLGLLQTIREAWKDNMRGKRFYHVSTDEVYGALEMDNTLFIEETPYDPQSPHSASKASSGHFVGAYHSTYKLPVVISNCSDNYGSHQYPEKFTPVCIYNIVDNKPLPIYGEGENIYDWLFVEDHARIIDAIFHQGKDGDTYNTGGFNERRNIDLVRVIIKKVDKQLGRPKGTSKKLITFVTDRAGHDLRYVTDATKLKNELGWEPLLQFEEGIQKTIEWYLERIK